METTTQLLKSISKLYEQEKKVEEKKREEGDFFNVFSTIGLRTEEVRLHSAFIAELLNPKGTHGLAHRFLQAFLEVIGMQDDYFDYRHCPRGIITERWIGPVTETEGGKIDIIIEDGNHAIIIENKIFAGDQENQMIRYSNYGKMKFPNGYRLLYLTLDGHEPDNCSIGNIKDYKTISYKSEVIEWLEKCFDIAKGKPLVQTVIRQYLELVKQLTNSDMDTKYRNDLMKMMLEPENAIAVGEMLQLWEDWLAGVIDAYIWKPLEEYAKQNNMLFGKECEKGKEGGAWVYRKEWKYYGIFVWTESKYNWYGMFVGVSWFEKPNWKNQIFKKDSRKLDCLISYDPDVITWPYGWEYLPEGANGIRNWDYPITEKIVKGEVVGFIKQKFEEILAEIEEKELRMP